METDLDLHAEIKRLRAVLKDAADAVERVAFKMEAPNNYTPQFVQIATMMRGHEQSAGYAEKHRNEC